MKKLILASSAMLLALATLEIAPASAAQFGPAKPGINAESSIVKVRDGCGYRRFRDRWGHCRWM